MAVFRREQSARTVNLHPTIKPKTGLLNTLMRSKNSCQDRGVCRERLA